MSPEPRRKDEHRNREENAGRKPDEAGTATPEEYTAYRERDRGDRKPEKAEAVREADLQPGRPEAEQEEGE